MALVDTQGFVMAVDRSLLGPQGRRWIERKLPEVATNMSFVAVSAFGACMLVFHICRDFSTLGYQAILQTPKYMVNAVIMHLVARALRWHVDRMLGGSFMQGHEMPDFFPRRDGDSDRVLWPWQSAPNKDRTASVDSTESDGEREQDLTKKSPSRVSGTIAAGNNRHRRTRSAESVNANNGERSIAAVAASAMMDATSTGMRIVMGETEPIRKNSDHGGHDNVDRKNNDNNDDASKNNNNNDSDDDHLNNERGRDENAGGQRGRGGGGGRGFPDLFAACRPHHHSHSPISKAPPSTGSDRARRRRRTSFSATSPGPGRSPGAAWDRERVGSDKDRDGSLSPASRVLTAGRRGGGSMERTNAGSVSDNGASGGNGAGSRGSRQRLQELSHTATATGEVGGTRREGDGQNQGGYGSGNDDGDEEMDNERVADLPRRRSSKGGGSWRSIDTISRALKVGSGRRRTQHGGDRDRGSEHQQLNFFTEADQDELLHSTFFIKMCDDASWLYVEDHPYHPEWNWLLSLWGGYKIAPRFQGEVKQNEAHRMLFQCENGRHSGHVRIRSRATNTFLFFLGVKQPLTWVAWDRDVVGGDWEDLKLEWAGKPDDGVLVGDERGRVLIRSRSMNAYVSWDGSRFTHVPSREGAAVFMFQRMAAPSRTRRSRRTGNSWG